MSKNDDGELENITGRATKMPREAGARAAPLAKDPCESEVEGESEQHCALRKIARLVRKLRKADDVEMGC